MASVLIRNLSDETKRLLTIRARNSGRSFEAEVRFILEASASTDIGNPDESEPFGDWLVRIKRPGYEDFADEIASNRQAELNGK